MQTNQFAGVVSSILGIVQRYMDQRMDKIVKVAVQIQSDRLRDEAQAENEEFLKNLDKNIQKIIKEQVKEQVKVQVSKILPKIEKTVNEQLETEVLTRSSNSSKKSYDVAADLSEMELKKNLIEKMEVNKSIHRSDEQRNLYKALVEAYESDKIILDTYRDVVTLKRHRDDDADKDEEPFAESDWGSKRTTGKSTQGSKSQQRIASESAPVDEPLQTTHDLEEPSHQEFETGVADDHPIAESSQHLKWFQQQKKPLTPDRDWNKTLSATHKSIQPWIRELAKQADSRSFFNELMDTPVDFLAFLMNRLKVDTLTPKLLAGPTYELMKGSCKSLVEVKFFLKEVYKVTTDQLDWNNPKGQQYPHNLLMPLSLIPNSRGHRVIPFDLFINNDLEYLHGGSSIRKYTTSVTKIKAADYGHIKWIEDLVPRTMWSQEPIVEWHNYKHLDWITVHRDDDKLYKFKEGDFKRLRIQDIKDMLLLLCVEDLQLDVESYQKKLNLIRPNTYHSNLKRKEDYTAYSNPRGFVYQNKDKQNRLMQIDELHKFSDGMLNDVRTALDDLLKGIQMKYLPQTIWRKSDKERAAAMIQAIDKQLKTRRIMRSLERSILTDSQVTPTKPGRMTKPYSSHRFIANCFNAGHLKMEVKEMNHEYEKVLEEKRKALVSLKSGSSRTVQEECLRLDFKQLIMMDVKFGSCGSKGGINPWKFILEDGGTFTKITILNTDDCVYSIRLKQDSPTYGGKTSSGTTKTTLKLMERKTCCFTIALRDYCDKNYHQLLPIIAEKVHQEKVQQEKLKPVKAHLNLRMLRRTPSQEHQAKRGTSERGLDPDISVVCPKVLSQGAADPSYQGREIRKENDDSRRQSYHSSHRDTKRCYQSSRSRGREPASEKHHNERASSHWMEALSESE
nr:hypothetical protein [Tanacetum cinerariifolium]